MARPSAIRSLTIGGGLITALLMAGCGGGGAVSGPLHPTAQLRLEKPGLALDRPFDRPAPTSALTDTFELNGSAPVANRTTTLAADGLHVGVRAHAPGTWEGYFAVTRASFPTGSVFHVRMQRPPATVAAATETGETVFAVQTGTTKQTGDINYVLVSSLSTGGSTHWAVGYAHGHIANASTSILWHGPNSPSAELGQDITLRTDGHRALEVYFGAQRVYASSALSMQIEPPLQPYLEVQGRGIAYESRFTGFWVTRGAAITVLGLARGDRVQLAAPGSGPITGRADADGTARLTPPLPEVRGHGALSVQRGSVSVSRTVDYAGGDEYRLSG
ncbi:MAG TPA: hypothetical protein VGN69_07825 [Solirubrobacteraceae bacterium]|jgi:hypothetical protein|nr:hypothetical protein [Solirubrobacteraceae bacterium]